MSIATNYLLAIVRENKPHKLIELDAKYLNRSIDLPVYEFAVSYFRDYGVLPPAELLITKYGLEELPGTLQFWEDSFSKLRFSLIFETGVSQISEFISKGQTDKARDGLLKMFSELEHKHGNSGSFSRAYVLNEVLESIPRNRIASGLLGIPTGWETLNEMTFGYQPGNVYVISARMKMGKTMLLIWSAEAAYISGSKILVISMEMTRSEFFVRVLSLLSSISATNILHGHVSMFAERSLRSQVSLDGRNDYIFQEGLFKTNINEIGFKIQMEKPDIVFIDGAYLLRVSGSSKMPMWEKATEVISQLKMFSVQYNIPIVCTYQLNRDAARKGSPGPENIHYSDAIPQIATTTIAITDSTLENEKKMTVIANRSGPTGEIVINWDWQKADFSEIRGVIDQIADTDPPDVDIL